MSRHDTSRGVTSNAVARRRAVYCTLVYNCVRGGKGLYRVHDTN